MNTLITLACPSCGANLEVHSGEKQFTCKYCGNAHLLSESMSLPSDMVCPLGPHGDLVSKVSFIVRMDQPQKLGSQSELAAQFTCPAQPHFEFEFLKSRAAQMTLIVIGAGSIAFMANGVLYGLLPETRSYGFFILWAILILLGLVYFEMKLRPRFMELEKEHRKKLRKWGLARAHWENAYYCQRHDIVFIKGQGQAIPVDKFRAYLDSLVDLSEGKQGSSS